MIPLDICIKFFTNYILYIHFLLVFANLKMRQFPLNYLGGFLLLYIIYFYYIYNAK